MNHAPDRQPVHQGTVLVVDDAPDTLRMLCDALAQEGYTVLVARDGLQALDRLDVVVPDAILLDGVMPGLSGFETCQRIKAHPQGEAVPVIFMTGLSETADIVAGFDAGGVDYVVKPLRIEEVLARLNTHVRNARAAREAREAVQRASDASSAFSVAAAAASAASAERLSHAALTPRETEVLTWLARGKTNRDIADILGMSHRTVNKHLEHIFEKLGVETRAAAAALASQAIQA
ncbi:LuxR family two component transcriptional regulator [Aquabacterium commune]|uniref:LuxR family two component transcriptional regulator n=1 Tax=Aquabacterium commune TaxID=70586 RepID=A0A4V3CWC9_9BURK|nr:DNA-binding response regulator [Aquabacterium commune]TDP85888.1 LuxR family two component transcriptional regulator [Aquabacterium commune]